MNLTRRILIAMVAAILLGKLGHDVITAEGVHEYVRFVLNDLLANGLFALIGKIFVASLKLMVVPLVFVSLVCGVCNLTDQSTLGRMSIKTIGLYLITTSVAISLALFFANLIDPGKGAAMTSDATFTPPQSIPFLDVIANIFPTNPVAAMAEGNMLQVIVFAILIGMAIARAGIHGEHIAKTFNDWNAVLMQLVTMLMNLAPYGVFSLLFSLFAAKGLGPIEELISYMFTVVTVLLIHGLVVYSLFLRLLTGLSPVVFLKKMWPVQIFAFSSASSSATLPVTMRNVEHHLGVNNRVASFALPLGATINMDGTAIMQGVATVFIAQAFAIDLGWQDYLMVIATATLASIGTAGVPGVGLITLSMVLGQVGLPVEGIALIIGVDRLLDMIRTAVNVTGDAMVATVVAHSEKELDLAVYRSDALPPEPEPAKS
ncbi:MAG TPA: dicarboxylate/amino acid:cation symporter [Oceanospirillales bacterium]|nr:dicarboxylate/amino acid:cation symporter [Oceanospirillaceae bacterium]HBS41255.1 dicarboxylate/amino acid:cation symporter [Oceanospirillales bacterium]|tara:strand:+ start:869 stop:2161 length:1293 start_codon:yes stop_codon:yes gene_type:complete